MSFQVGIDSLSGTVFFQVGLCNPLRTMTNYTAKVLPLRDNPATNTCHSNDYSRTSPDYSPVSHDNPRNSVHAHENHVSDNSKRFQFNDRLDDVIKRYSGGSRNAVSPLDIDITRPEYKTLYEGMCDRITFLVLILLLHSLLKLQKFFIRLIRIFNVRLQA